MKNSLLLDIVSRIALYMGLGVLVGQGLAYLWHNPTLPIPVIVILGIIVILGLIGQVVVNKK